MMTRICNVRTSPVARQLRTVVVVVGPEQRHVPDIALGSVDHDVVLVESSHRAYAQIKRVSPDLVIVCLSEHDTAGCQLLSMLALDRDVSRIPLITHLCDPLDDHCDEATHRGHGTLGRTLN
jgi:DNA-binding response OmpR family regulator